MIHSEIDNKPAVDFNPFEGEPIQKVVPSTESQKEIFASCLLGEKDANLAYNLSMSLDFTGDLNIDVLKECTADLVLRHESLRSSFSDDGGHMIIYEHQTVPFLYQDLTQLSTAQQKEEVDSYLWRDAETEFDIVNGPLIRFALFRLAADKHLFAITVHHLICDGWSLGILLEDLSKFYNSKLYGTPLPPKASAFSEYAVKSILFEDTDDYKKIVDYWKKEYVGNIPVFEIPPDFPRPPIRSYKGRRDDYILPASIAEAVKKTGVKYGSSFVNILMSAFEVLLYKYTGHDDIVIGLPTSGQAATETYDLVGHCVNLLPLRSNPDPDISFADYLRSRKSKTLRDYENQQFTFGTFLKELKMQRDLSRMPLAPVSLNIDMGIDLQVNFKGLDYKLVHNKRVSETYELFVNVADSEDGYQLQWSYNTQLYKASTMKGLMDKYTYLLTQIVENPEQKIGDIKLQDEKSLVEYWKNWNDRDNITFEAQTLLEQINESCAANADKTALYFKGTSYTYKEVREQSNRMAHYLLEAGVKKGAVVGVAMERSVDLVISILGVIKAGGVFVPLDPQYAQERIEYMLENSGAEILLTSTAFQNRFTTDAREILVDQVIGDLEKYDASLPAVTINPDDLVYILYTSGSTGKPKGVMIANKSLVNYISWAVSYYLKGKPGVFPLYTSISFDLTITSIFSPLVSGSLLKIYEEDEPITMLEKIFTDEQVNVIKLTPSHLKLVKDSHVIRQNLQGQFLTLIVGGEELETLVAKEVHELCKGNVIICNEYGPTEATVGCMIYDYTLADDLSAVPIGVPIANANIYLLDANLSPVPKGIVGEIYIGGDCVAEGYYKKPELTAERFLPDPFVPGGRMYKTGDNAIMLDNDVILFKGRIDDQVKLRGFRIELGEIDYHLSNLQNVKNNITIVKEDGSGNGYLVSYVVLQTEQQDTESLKSDWRAALRHKLPDYMVPGAFVIIDELPLTTNGKVDKKRLPAPEIQSRGYVAPETSEELILANIWKEAFKREQVGVYDNFFELGGHSLLGVRVIKMLEAKAGVRIGVTSIFRYPVLRDLAAECSRLKDSQKAPTVTQPAASVEQPAEAPLRFKSTQAQLEIWQECFIGGDEANVSYNVTHNEYLSGDLDVDILKKAFQALMDRHELLKATFSKDGAYIDIHPNAALPFSFQDISSLNKKDQEAFINDFLRNKVETPFVLHEQILFNIDVLKLNGNRYLFSLVVHHLISDGSSFDTIIKEAGTLYNAYKQGTQPLLPTASRFSDYARAQEALYESEAYRLDLNYWVSKFSNDIPVLDLPIDYAQPATRKYKCNVDEFSISEADTDIIEKFASRSQSTLTIFLRTVFDVLLYKYTGQQDFVVGLPVSDHVSDAGTSMVGHSVNMLPVRTYLDRDLSFEAYLNNRSEAMLSDYEHKSLTFGSLVKNIQIKRSAIKNTLISVSFSSQMEKTGISLDLQDIAHEPLLIREVYNNLELFIDTYKKDNKLHFQVIYRTDLFKPSTITSIMDKFNYLTRQIVSSPLKKIAAYKLEDERDILGRLKRWSGDRVELPQMSVVDMFKDAAHKFPSRVAITFNDANLTYSQVEEQVNQLTNTLLRAGVVKGDIVGIALDRGPQLPVSLLAVLQCGALYVPVDVSLPTPRIEFMLGDAGVKVLITSQSYEEKFSAVPKKVFFEEAAADKTVLENNLIQLSDSAYILYTSGSTGLPKGVEVTHGNLVNLLTAMRSMFKSDENLRLLSVTTISFDIVGVEMYLPLICGGQLVLTNNDQAKDGGILLDLITRYRVNYFQGTPATYKIMLESGWEKVTDCAMITCGEPLTNALAEEMLKKCTAFYNMYGPTETTIYSTGTKIETSEGQITIGKPIQNTEVYIIDKDGNLLPENIVGEICIAGEGVAREYHNRPGLNQEKFVDDPFSDTPGKMFKTGDLGKYNADGDIVCLGRKDHQVKLRGYRIELGEIDWQIKQLGGIRDVVTIVREDKPGDQRLVSYLITDEYISADNNSSRQWREQLRKVLPEYMVPSIFVTLDKFPLSSSGKIDKKELPKPANLLTAVETANADRPLSTFENGIKKIWLEELNVSEMSLNDDFFDMGGNSLIAIKVMERIKSETEIALPISTLFEHSTLGSIINLLGERQVKVRTRALVPIKTTGSRPPIYLIHGGALNILLYKNLAPFLDEEQPLYGIQALGLDGDLTHLSSIESIAARYLSEILEQRPDGPYIIIGYSYGGIVAHEMVKQLMAMGKEVKMLGVFDTNVSGRDVPESKTARVLEKVKRQLKKAVFIGGNLFRYPKDVIAYQWLLVKRKFFKTFIEEEYQQIYDYSPEVIAAYDKAYCEYKMERLDVNIILFRVRERIYFLDDPVYLGWRRYAKNVKVQNVTGDHKTFLLPPHNKELIHTIQKVLKNM